MMLHDDTAIAFLGHALAQARLNGTLADLPLGEIGSEDEAEAILREAAETFYDTQRGYVTLRLETPVAEGQKVEALIHAPLLTSSIVPPDQPFRVPRGLLGARWGLLFTMGHSYPDHDVISRRTAIAAVVKCELAIHLLGRRVPGGTPLDLRTALADFALHVATVQGPPVTGWSERLGAKDDLMSLAIDGHVVATQEASPFFRNAVDTLAVLAESLAHRGSLLNAGDRVAVGARLPAFQALPGQTITARFGRIGETSVRLV